MTDAYAGHGGRVYEFDEIAHVTTLGGRALYSFMYESQFHTVIVSADPEPSELIDAMLTKVKGQG